MRVVGRKPGHSDDVKRLVLDAARELLLADGLDGFSMRKLAARIGYTPTAIYHHFADKQAILLALMEGDSQAFRAALGRVGETPDPVERVRRMGIACVEFAIAHPDHYRLLFMTPYLNHVETPLTRGDPTVDPYAFLRAAVAEGAAAGRFHPDLADVDDLCQVIIGSVHGLIALHIAKGGDCHWVTWNPLRPTAERLIAAVLRGVVAPA